MTDISNDLKIFDECLSFKCKMKDLWEVASGGLILALWLDFDKVPDELRMKTETQLKMKS